MSDVYSLHRGTAPLLVSLPHDGTVLPDNLAGRMTPRAREVPDTDWHVGRLYRFARVLGASILVPTYSRYVVDLNRPSDNASLYPGQNTTGLCPVTGFDGEPIYKVGEEPHNAEIKARVERYWQPYHDALADEISRIRGEHGRVVLWEGHSIRSIAPFLFEGRLPDYNLGTVDGASCSSALQDKLEKVLRAQRDRTHVVNGRFKGGYITRHYSAVDAGVETVQLELAQLNYMDETTFEYLPEHAAATQVVLRALLERCLER